MPLQRSTNYELAHNKETVWGTPVTTGAKALRIVSADLAPNVQFMQSEEINSAHRETADTVAVGRSGGGSIEGELSYLTWDWLLESCLGATFTGTGTRTLKTGKTLVPLTFQEKYDDLTANKFRVYRGAVVQAIRLSLVPRQMIRLSAQFASRMPTVETSTAVGTVAAANSEAVMNPVAHIQLLQEGGASLTACSSLELAIENDMIEAPSLLTADLLALFQGRFKVSGTLGVYMEDVTLLNKMINQTESSFALTLGGAAAKRYAITLPRIKYTGERPSGVRGSSMVQQTFTFDALYHGATAASFQIVATD